MSVKRKRGESNNVKDLAANLTANEQKVYDLILTHEDMGILAGHISKELKMTIIAVQKCAQSLEKKELIKQVPDFQKKKRLMGKEFEPNSALTGGIWYDKGNLDTGLIDTLKKVIRQSISKQKIATADGLLHAVKAVQQVFSVKFTLEHIKDLLNSMILDKEIIKVKSNGLGEYAHVPIGEDCYKFKPKHTKVGALSSTPCGVCPVINQCTPDGMISPATCAYYSKWLEF